MLVFETLYTQSDKVSFIDKVKSVSYKLGINPNWLMYVMYSESGLNPHIQATYYKFTGCGGGYAGGLIGFTPCTMKGLGWTGTPDAFVKMSGLQQMDYVYSFYKKYTGKIKSYADLYLVTAFPVALGKPLDWVFESPSEGISASEYVKGNPAFDFMPKDGKVTLKEFYAYQDNRVRSKVPSAYLPEFLGSASTNSDDGTDAVEWNYIQRHERDIVIGTLIVITLGMIGFVVYLLVKR